MHLSFIGPVLVRLGGEISLYAVRPVACIKT